MTVTIIGSGVAGTAAALQLAERGIRCQLLDVGFQPAPDKPVRENFYRLRQREDVHGLMVGKRSERVECLSRKSSAVPAKLTPPRMRYITQDAERLSPLRQTGYAAVQSFAAGGLANAWGAGLYRFNKRDLAGFPITHEELSPYYGRLAEEIGISGEADDLTPFFGEENGIQPPLRLSEKADRLYGRYQRCRTALNRRGVFLGRPRLGVLTEPRQGRAACDYTNLEFWQPELPYIYTPAFTLRRLIDEGKIEYRRGILVKSWARRDGRIRIQARDLSSNTDVTFDTDVLLLAAGAVGSARLALQSRADYSTRLDLLDNPALQIPLVLPRFIGGALQTDCFGLTQLILVYDPPESDAALQASILEITSPARSEFFSSIPLSARGNLKVIRHIVPAMLVMQLFFPATRDRAASLSLQEDGALRIEGQPLRDDIGSIKPLLRAMLRLGALTHRSIVVTPEAGQGIHYAGTLPMKHKPERRYECDRFGELYDEPGVHVIDGAAFPALPAKNYSFSIMANAMRVANHVADNLPDGGRVSA